ncbi:hypothetical protein GZH53_00060, partial [Flavihumibacter sp. R14]|nr:hypothetical protein [Flavihumibacter soli]
GLITGTVTAATGTYTVNLTVKDQQNLSATTSFVITVGSAPALTEVIRINAGGPAIQFGTQQWKADQYFTGGSVFST